MALFKTELKTEAEQFVKDLPKRATLQGISMTPEHNIVILWENEDLHTGLTVPTDYPLNMLRAGKLPQRTVKASERPKATVTPPKKENAPTVTPEAKSPSPVYLSEKELNESIAKGIAIEYQGIRPVWVQYNPKVDRYTAGYFYRPKEKVVEQKSAVA